MTRARDLSDRGYLFQREVLEANRTYYVRTDGNDSNDGLTNSSGGAFLTIQKAIDVTASLDCSIYNVTISVADGTYTGSVTLKPILGAGTYTIQGNTGTPANTTISTSGVCISGSNCGKWTINGFKLTSSSSSTFTLSGGTSNVTLSNMEFGTASVYHIYSEYGAIATISTNYTISGNTLYHLGSARNGIIFMFNITVTLTGTPAFTYYALASDSSIQILSTLTFSGSATGTRYLCNTLSLINTGGGGATYLPGNAGGSAVNGGVYV